MKALLIRPLKKQAISQPIPGRDFFAPFRSSPFVKVIPSQIVVDVLNKNLRVRQPLALFTGPLQRYIENPLSVLNRKYLSVYELHYQLLEQHRVRPRDGFRIDDQWTFGH